MASQRLVRLINERKILSLLRVEGPMPRADLSRRLSVTRATITNVMDGLIARGLVREDDLPTPVDQPKRLELGRPGINVSIDPKGAFMLGVEIGVGKLRFALIDLSTSVAERSEQTLPPDITPLDVVDRIVAYLKQLGRKKTYKGLIGAIGVAVPGLVRDDGFILHLPILGWKNVPLLELVARRTDVAASIENSANAAAFGEVYCFPATTRDFILSLKLGNGCGGASIMNGRLLRGANGSGAEFGHIRIASDGPTCSCGQKGCLETFVNLQALNRFYFGDQFEPGDIDEELPTRLAKLYTAGDPKAKKAVAKFERYLKQGLVSLTNIFNPREVILGGALRPVVEIILENVQTGIHESVVPGMAPPKFNLTMLGEYESAIGAAAIAHHAQFDISNVEVEAEREPKLVEAN